MWLQKHSYALLTVLGMVVFSSCSKQSDPDALPPVQTNSAATNTSTITLEKTEEEKMAGRDLLPADVFLQTGQDSSQDASSIQAFQEQIVKLDALPENDLNGETALIQLGKIWSNNSRGASLNSNGELDIQVCWEPEGQGTHSSYKAYRDLTRQAAQTWERAAKIRFVGWNNVCNPQSAGIRIVVEDLPDTYSAAGEIVVGAPRTLGVGTDVDGVKHGMRLNFTFDQWSPSCKSTPVQQEKCIHSIAVHEFGHALGMEHEQIKLAMNAMNTLTAGAKQYYQQKCQDQQVELQQAVEEVITTSPLHKLYWWNSYDPNSVMNYCHDIYSRKVVPSELDQRGIAKFYGKR